MTLSDIAQLVSLKLGEQSLFYPKDEIIRGGINPAQRLLCLAAPKLLRQRVTHTVNADLPFIDVRTLRDSDGILFGDRVKRVNRVILGDVSGDAPVRNTTGDDLLELRKMTLQRLMYTNDWMRQRSEVRRYWLWRKYWLGLYKRPIDSTTITVIVNATPAELVNDTDVPQMQAVYHREIAETATGLLLVKEGTPQGVQGLQRVGDSIQRVQGAAA